MCPVSNDSIAVGEMQKAPDPPSLFGPRVAVEFEVRGLDEITLTGLGRAWVGIERPPQASGDVG